MLTEFGANITQSGEYDAMASLCRWQEWFFKHALVQRCLNNSEIQCLIFVTGQGGGRRQCGGIVDWRQRRTGANSRCCIHCYLRNAVLVQHPDRNQSCGLQGSCQSMLQTRPSLGTRFCAPACAICRICSPCSPVGLFNNLHSLRNRYIT